MSLIYIAGKITGEDYKQCKEKFSKAEFILKRKGYRNIVNPMRLCSPNVQWDSAMKICIQKLIECDHIFMLADWQDSRGAMLEHHIAKHLGLKMIYEEANYVE